MNAVTTAPQSRIPATPSTGAQRASLVRQGLKQVYEAHLSVFDELTALRLQNPDWMQFIHHRDPNEGQVRSLHTRDRLLEVVRETLATLPSEERLDELATRVNEAACAGPDRRQTSLIVGLMIDAFPNARPHSPETYQETLVFELTMASLPPAAVAKACSEVVRNKTFLPSISEVLEEANRAKEHLIRMDAFLDKAVQKLAQCQHALVALPALADLPAFDPPLSLEEQRIEDGIPW